MAVTIRCATSARSSTRTVRPHRAVPSPTTTSVASSATSRPSGAGTARMPIKYLGSKRRLVPALSAVARAAGARTAVDLFTGTTRVAQAFKAGGVEVTAVDNARYAHTFARCYVETDAE